MGNVPSSRVQLSHPFTRVGVDFAGPFTVKTSTMRKVKTLKPYNCVYVSLAVKAVHFEGTSDLTTEAFLASFHWFVAKRGIPSDVLLYLWQFPRGQLRDGKQEINHLNSASCDIRILTLHI